MKFLFGGCSHTYGDELNPETREQERYSHIVCQHFGAEEVNTSEKGRSIPDTIYNLYDVIKDDLNFNLCLIQITYANRIALPLFHEIQNVSLAKSKSTQTQTKKILAKLISITNQFQVKDNYWKIHCAHLNMFEDSCKLRNIKTLYFCTEYKQRASILRRCPSLDILDVGLMDYIFDNNLPFGRLHPLAGAHEAFAKNILIPEIEKRV